MIAKFHHRSTSCVALIASLLAVTSSSWAGNGTDHKSRWPPGLKSPNFDLTDFDGQPRSLADYRGRIPIVVFGFTNCPSACPAELFELAQLVKQLGPVAPQVQVLFITLDPVRDTPAALKRFVRSFDPSFIALTADTKRIDKTAADFFVQYAKTDSGHEYAIDHSTGFFVFDKQGKMRFVEPSSTKTNELLDDVTLLTKD